MKQKLVVKNLSSINLRDVNFEINKNDLNAIISKDYDEKTELIDCLAGLQKYAGEITLNGNVITKSDISVFKGIISLYNSSAFENVLESAKNIGLDENNSKKKVYELFKKIDVDNLLYKNINNLSFSEKKVISILKCLIREPKILILEDPFTSLDLNYKNKIFNHLKSMKNTIILFTTDTPEELLLADNIIMIKEGKIIANDPKENVLENENLFIKNGFKMPFIVDISHKLKSYELIDKVFYEEEDLIKKIWK